MVEVAQEAGVRIYYMNSRHFNAIECDERRNYKKERSELKEELKIVRHDLNIKFIFSLYLNIYTLIQT